MFRALAISILLTAMPQTGTYKVSGTVERDDKQDPATAAQSNQIRISGPSTSIVPIGSGGTFEFPSIRPGTYQIVVGPRVTMAPMTVVVSDKDVQNLRVVVPVSIDVNGTVSIEGNGPRPRFQISFTRIDTPGSNPTITSPAATFTVALAPGEYKMTASGLPTGYSLKSAKIGNADVLSQTFKVAQGSPITIAILLDVISKEVRGKITMRGNAPVPRLVFLLASGPVVTTTAAGSLSVPTNVELDGSFKVTLPEGERSITIVPGSIPAGYSVDSFVYGNVDLLKSPIRVASTDTAEIRIVVDATTVKPHNISGKVTGLLTTQGVRVVLQGGNLGTGVESSVAPDGSFGFSEILPGNYSARLSLSGQVVSTSVSVGNNDVTNVTINYPRRFYIGAHVLVDGEASLPPSITLEARSSTGAIATSSPASGPPTPLVLTVSDGSHRISVRNVPPGYSLKSMKYGNVDLQTSPLIVDGPITWEIVVRLAKTR